MAILTERERSGILERTSFGEKVKIVKGKVVENIFQYFADQQVNPLIPLLFINTIATLSNVTPYPNLNIHPSDPFSGAFGLFTLLLDGLVVRENLPKSLQHPIEGIIKQTRFGRRGPWAP